MAALDTLDGLDMSAAAELHRCAALISQQARQAAQPAFEAALRRLMEATQQVGSTWCGSWLPGFANLYDASLQTLVEQPQAPVPLSGRCKTWPAAALRDAIYRLAGAPDIAQLLRHAMQVASSFELALCQSQALLATLARERGQDTRLDGLRKAMDRLQLVDPDALIESWRPHIVLPQHDAGAARRQPREVPTHLAELAAVQALRSPLAALNALASLLRLTAEHLGTGAPVPAGFKPSSVAAACATRSA